MQAARVRRRTTRTVKPHPIELALVAGLALLLALRTLLVALLALVLAMAGWRPGATAPEPGPAVQTLTPRPSTPTTVVALRAEARARGIRTAGGRRIAQARRADLLAALA